MKVVGFSGPKGSGKDASAKILFDKGISKGKLSFAGPLKELCSKIFEIKPMYFNDPGIKDKTFAELAKSHAKDMKHLKEGVVLTAKVLRNLKKECASLVPEYDHTTGMMRYNINRVTISDIEGQVMKSPRQLLQFIGTDFIRNKIYSDWHLEAAFGDQVIRKLKKGSVYCVTDARFENEHMFLKRKFGTNFEAYYVERPEAEERLSKATHASELGVLEIKKLVKEERVIKNDGTLKQLEKKLLKLDIKSKPSPNKGESKNGRNKK